MDDVLEDKDGGERPLKKCGGCGVFGRFESEVVPGYFMGLDCRCLKGEIANAVYRDLLEERGKIEGLARRAAEADARAAALLEELNEARDQLDEVRREAEE